MFRTTLLCCLVLAVGCAPADSGEDQAATGEDQMDTEMAAPGISLSDVAGTWTMEAMAADRDTVLVTYQMTATATEDGWTVTFPGRDPIPLRVVAVDGDSIVTEMGPYESALRDGVTVTSVRSVMRLEGDMINGPFTARYDTEGPDSVLQGRGRGTRGMQ